MEPVPRSRRSLVGQTVLWSLFGPQNSILRRFGRLRARFGPRRLVPYGSSDRTPDLAQKTLSSIDWKSKTSRANTLISEWSEWVCRAKIALKRSPDAQITTSFGRIARGRSFMVNTAPSNGSELPKTSPQSKIFDLILLHRDWFFFKNTDRQMVSFFSVNIF